jgi:RNA polymerase sigma-70 factor (ECF subfamily)
MDTSDVIAQALTGNEGARRALYKSYHAAAFRLAYVLLGDACDAEEVVQDTFVYLFRNLHRYDEERGSFWTWLRVTLVSRCRNKRRRRRLSTVSLEILDAVGRSPADPNPSRDPARALQMESQRRVIWEALEGVSPGARDALILRYYEGLPYTEIGEILGCSAAAARSRVAHGKVQLRRLLTEDEEMTRRSCVAGPAEVGRV